MISAGRFFIAVATSVPKKSFPLILILVIASPWVVTFPSASTLTPGSFLRISSTASPCLTGKEEALNVTVSSLILIAVTAVITTSSKLLEEGFKMIGGNCNELPLDIMYALINVLNPMNAAESVKLVHLTLFILKFPSRSTEV